MSERLAALIVRARVAIVVFWAAAAVLATLLLPSVEQAQSGSLGDLVPSDAEAIDAEIRSSELFGFPLLSRTLVVERDPEGLTAAEQADVVRRTVALNRKEYEGLTGVGGSLAILNTLGEPPFSREDSTTAITQLFFPPEIGRVGQTGLANRFVERHVPEFDRFVGISGAVPARQSQVQEIKDSLPLVELATLLLVLLAVGAHYRAVGAPLANIAAVAVAYLVSIRVMAGLGKAIGVSVPSEVEPVIVVLLFGAITDYSIFFLSRFRRMLADGLPAQRAAERTTAELLPIIVTAGLTVAGASAALVVARLAFFQAFGPGMAMAVLTGLIVVITLIPALLALAGERLFWPRRPGRELRLERAAEETPDEKLGRPVRSRAVGWATARPLLVAGLCTVGLLAAASGLLRLEVGQTLIRGLPDGAEPKMAYRQASQGFAPGILSPTVLILERRGITRERRALAEVQELLTRQPGVAAVVGPRQQPADAEFGAVFSRTGNAVRYVIVLDSDPLGSRAIFQLRQLRDQMPGILSESSLPLTDVSFAGDTALSEETVRKTEEDLKRIAPAVLLVVIAVLAVFLRALVAPLYLVAASMLALAASLGLTAYVFQDLLGHGELTFYVPFAAAVLLLALGSDYNVFLAGRIWQEVADRPLREAVQVGGARAARAITIAGLVLAGSFALLGLVELRSFRELAFAMSVGLLIDAFVVRTLLVPALMVLVGERSGWPGRRLAAGRATPVPPAPRSSGDPLPGARP